MYRKIRPKKSSKRAKDGFSGKEITRKELNKMLRNMKEERKTTKKNLKCL